MTAATRVAIEIGTLFVHCMFCCGICGLGSSSGGFDIGLVGIVVVMVVKYWWSSDGDRGDDSCCNGGSCD